MAGLNSQLQFFARVDSFDIGDDLESVDALHQYAVGARTASTFLMVTRRLIRSPERFQHPPPPTKKLALTMTIHKEMTSYSNHMERAYRQPSAFDERGTAYADESLSMTCEIEIEIEMDEIGRVFFSRGNKARTCET